MAVLPPYDHGLRTQERKIDNNDSPSTWLLHQDGNDGWAGQIKRSYIYHRRHDAFAGIQWGNQVFFSKPSTWRPNCGDGITQPDELMDRGQPFVGPQDCGAGAVDSCGDGELAPGEQCDDGDQDADDGCDHRCQLTQGSSAAEAMESCASLAATQPAGSYWINPASEDPADAFEAYCFWQGEGPAWTLMMKIDGRNDTFLYDAELWTNAEPLRPDAEHIDRFIEFKEQGFGRLEVSELLVGTALHRENYLTRRASGGNNPNAPWPHLGRQRKWMTFQVEGDPDIVVDGEPLAREPLTLQRLFTEQEPRGHTMTREGWLGFMDYPRLQEHCNTMGFNLELGPHRLRLGIIANNENDCNSPDSWLGLGGNHVDAWDYDRYHGYGSRDEYPNTINAAGNRNTPNWGHPRWGYLLVR
jgi:cysteine-rich repeat protein